ncbi:MAG TPA: coiled coil domain-containing protein [candidate division Zixibacteria bacterium]|nr:coiled coil domain-containing protein [candidate division Zixibacteria bacterium]
MGKKDDYERELQARLDEFSAEIERLKERADKAEADAQPWHRKQIEALQEKHGLAKEKLDELRESSDDAWEDMKVGIATAWDSVGNALKSAAKRFE